MIGLPKHYRSPNDLPFNHSCLAERFVLQSPDADPGGPGFWINLTGNSLLVQDDEHGLCLPGSSPGRPAAENALFIGTWDGRPCRLACVSTDVALPAGLRSESLLSQEPALPIDLLTLGGLGRMILHWEESSRFCAACGQTMQRLVGEWGKLCPNCRSHHFPHIHPCVIVLVQRPGEVLLTRKKEWTPNRYSLVAGFLEFGESLEEAVAREVAEETGVRIHAPRYVGSQCWPFPSQIMTGFVADYAGGELVIEEAELEDARWFPVDALPNLPPRRSIARYILDTVLDLP
jgi:NAD+ diphosphatase